MTDEEYKNDPRTKALADCLMFAINSFPNKPVFDPADNTIQTWHSWFTKAIEGSGFKLKAVEPEKKPKKSKGKK